MLKSRLPQIAAELDPRVTAAVHVGTEAIAADAASRAPDDPPIGEGLSASIEAKDTSEGYGIVAAWYYHFIEFGTVRQAAQPFLIPAVEEGRKPLERTVEKALREL